MNAKENQQRSDTGNVSEETVEVNEFLRAIIEDPTLDVRRSFDTLIAHMNPNGGAK